MAFLGGASSSSTPSWIYDAFLSFYGEDTRKGFTDHLYAALKQKRVITFKDNEKLEKGKDISQELLKAIQKTQYAIVVISKQYAFSKWCMIELAKILECRTKTGMIVLPVFYYVDPSDVRNQKGSFVEAFVTYSQNTEVDEKQWKMWKGALKEVGNLSRWHIHDRHEAIVVEDISRQILEGVNHTSLNIFDRLVGIASRAFESLSLLSLGSDDVRFIGICGMGGIGKTTLAKIIYNRVSSYFEARCFVADIREVAQKYGIVHLQTQLFCEILHESNLKIWNTYIGVELIARSIRNRNAFIVLDDVDKENQLEVLAKSHAWFGQGSRIVVTSRNRHLLERYVDKIYEVVELSEDESLELFCQKAFKNDHPKENYVKLSKDIVDCAQGLPLAIEVFGSYLFGRKMVAWKAAQKKLKANLKEDILDRLQISYEGLETSQKRLFLDIACVFDAQYANRLKCLNDYFAIDIEVLKDKSLIKDLGGTFRMHDLLKKMGQQIVYRECPGDPSRRSRLWCYEDIINVLNCNIGMDTIEAINLDLSLHKGEQLNLEGFSKMKRLKMLVICNGQSYHGFHALEWYGDLSNFILSNELLYLEWVGYPLENLPINFQANKLLLLKMPYNCIKQLSGWKNFHNVKFIDMSYSCNLIDISDFNEMPNLVELDFQYCRSLSTIPSSLGNLKWLKKLEMEGCDCLNKLPEEINLESLEYLNLAGCLRLEKFPNVSGNMKSLEFLDLIGTAIKELPSSFKGLSSLKHFNFCGDLSYRTCLQRLGLPIYKPDQVLEYDPSRPPWHTKLRSKINAYGSGSKPISFLHFLNVFSSLNSLQKLDLSYRNLSNENISNELCYLLSLKYLDLSGNMLTTIPMSIYQLSKLQFLYLRSCTRLKALPKPSFSQLSRLELLHLGYFKMVDGVIPDDLSCFSSLKRLDLCNNKFRKLPNLIQLSQVHCLWLEDCTELEALPKLPSSLRSLEISNCISLKIPWVGMDKGLNSNCTIDLVDFDCDGRPHQILQLPSYQQIGLSFDGCYKYKSVYFVGPASLSEILEWFNWKITNFFGTIESCFEVGCFRRRWWEYCGGFALLILYRMEPDTCQEKRKKQKVDECGNSNYQIFDGIDSTRPHFLCHFQFNEAVAKNSFLWAGHSEDHKTHKVAWQVVCSPKKEGGLGLLNLKVWNKVLLGRSLWNLINCPNSSLWSKWIHSTKCRGNSIMDLDIKGTMAWSWRGLLKLRQTLTSTLSKPSYSCKETYKELRQVSSEVEWYNLIWSGGISKHNFIGWLICRDKLPTAAVVSRWLPSIDLHCDFCGSNYENRSHLFFQCTWTNQVWRSILAQQGIRKVILDWESELQWMIKATKGKDLAAKLLKLSFLACLYCIWLERNRRRFQNKSIDISMLLAKIRRVVRGRASLFRNIKLSQANVLLSLSWRIPNSIFS